MNSIDKINTPTETQPIAKTIKTYELPEELSLGTGESVQIGGFLAVGRPRAGEVAVALREQGQDATGDRPGVQEYLETVVMGDMDFLRSVYYNHVARAAELTVPNLMKLGSEQVELLKSTGLDRVSAAGSLAGLENEGIATGLVLSAGESLTEKADIEARAAEIGRYSETEVQFAGDNTERCILLTDATGNRMLLPQEDETAAALEQLFGYTRSDEPLFDAQAALRDTHE